MCKTACERPEQVARFERALPEVTGQPIRVEFKLQEAAATTRRHAGVLRTGSEPQPPAVSPHQRLLEAVARHPLVQRASELFGARADSTSMAIHEG